MNIERRQMMEALSAFVEDGHTVVLGVPGVGKSHTLARFAIELISINRTCVFVPIDNLIVNSEDDLKQELGYRSEDFVGFLASQKLHRGEKGIVIFDAFDAARSDRTRIVYLRVIKKIIEELGDSWIIVVSARIYDARKSHELMDLFQDEGQVETSLYSDPTREIKCRHFFIPELTDEEINEASENIQGLSGLFQSGSQDLRDLLRIPFNIWLVEKISSTELDLMELSGVQSEVQLLEAYWSRRVDSNSNREDLRLLLLNAIRVMLEHHSLAVRKEEVYKPDLSAAWKQLMSLEILREVAPSNQRITFGHNILFDYAVSVLLIEDAPEAFENFIQEDYSRPVFLRPSINYFFTRLWYSDPTLFWSIFWHILPSKLVPMRLIARLIPMAVVATELRSEKEILPLLSLRDEGLKLREEAILRLLQALRALNKEGEEVWATILLKISLSCGSSFVGELSNCVHFFFDRAKQDRKRDIQKLYGETAREILTWIWTQRSKRREKRFDRLGSVFILPIVAKTFATAPDESRLVLEPILEIVKEKDFPIDYLFQLTHELDHIVSSDPDFVSHVYSTVFMYSESSEEKTVMGTPILQLSSTRRQDYRMCYFNLKEHFPTFVETAPEVATKTAINCLTPLILNTHVIPYLREGVKLQDLVETFAFRGKQTFYIADMSSIWAQNKHPKEPLEIVAALFDYLDRTVKNSTKTSIIEAILNIFRDQAVLALFWARLLELGAKNPIYFASQLIELCTATPIQKGNDVIYQLANFVMIAESNFSTNQLRTLEQSFLSLASQKDEHNTKESLERRRNLLLTRISPEKLQTQEAKAIVTDLHKKKMVPSNEPLFRFKTEWAPYDEKEWLHEQGVDWDKGANAKLHSYFGPLDGFSAEWRNKKPTSEAIDAVVPSLRDAFDLLHKDHGGDKPVENALWTKVGECAEIMARTTENPSSEEFQICRQVLLECSKHSEPKPDPEYDEKYEHPSWSPAPRNEAAIGLPWIASLAQGDSEVISAIEALSKDEIPSVRYLTSANLFRWRRHYEESFWKIVEYVADHEKNDIVKNALCHTLTHVVSANEERTCHILDKFKAIVLIRGDEIGFLDIFIKMVMWLYLVRENKWGQSTAEEFLKKPRPLRKALSLAAQDALSYITPQILCESDLYLRAERAKHWIMQAVESASQELENLRDKATWEIKEEDHSTLRDLYEIIDKTVTSIYLNVRTFTESKENFTVNNGQRNKFYKFVKPILDKVVEVSDSERSGIFFASTAHYFMQLLNEMLQHDPKGVLHLSYRVADIACREGYHLDSMGVREVVKLVESILANYRDKVRDGESLEDLLRLLDIFVEVGWSEALWLVWRLDEIFR